MERNIELNHIELNNQVKVKHNDFWQISKDWEARDAYMEVFNTKYVKHETQYKRIKHLINENFYNPILLEEYKRDEINAFDKYVKSFNFEFKSYIAIKKFYSDYALKSNDRTQILESYEDRVIVVSLYLANGNIKKAKRFAKAILEGRYQPATPTFADAGKIYSGEMVSCFLLEMEDNLNSITYNLGTSMHLSKLGGGVAVNVSKIRSRGEALRGVKGITAGVLPILKLMENSFAFANKLDQRKGAGAAYLNIFHWDILEFLETKKINADEKSRIQSLSLGVIVPNKMLDLAKADSMMALFAPLSVKQEVGMHLDDLDMDEWYDKLLANPNVDRQMVSARKLFIKIAQSQLESGYPYLIYRDTAQKANPLKGSGKIKMSNLCTEIFQNQQTSEIRDYSEKDVIKRDISCILGSLNVVNVMEENNIDETVSTAVDMLTAVSDLTDIRKAPGIRKANNEYHAIGLGALNLHGFLAKNNIMYESEIAREFASVFFATVNYHSLKRSMQTAKEKESKFVDFSKSEYANGNYFNQYLENDFLPKSDKVKSLFKDITLPTKSDWEQLKKDVKKHGVYHAYRMAVAPNQSTSYISGATASVMPITQQVEERTYGNSVTYYPMPYLKLSNALFYKSAYLMNQERILDMVSVIQPHIDQGVSTILYVNSNTSTRDLAKLYLYAYKKNLKSLYYTRTKNLTIEECELCHA